MVSFKYLYVDDIREETNILHSSVISLILYHRKRPKIARVRKAFSGIILRSVPAFSLTFYRLHKQAHTLHKYEEETQFTLSTIRLWIWLRNSFSIKLRLQVNPFSILNWDNTDKRQRDGLTLEDAKTRERKNKVDKSLEIRKIWLGAFKSLVSAARSSVQDMENSRQTFSLV